VIIFGMPEQTNLKARLRGYEDALRQPSADQKIASVIDPSRQSDDRLPIRRTEVIEKERPKADAMRGPGSDRMSRSGRVLNRKNIKDKVVIADGYG